jgi:hypothetical protein
MVARAGTHDWKSKNLVSQQSALRRSFFSSFRERSDARIVDDTHDEDSIRECDPSNGQ